MVSVDGLVPEISLVTARQEKPYHILSDLGHDRSKSALEDSRCIKPKSIMRIPRESVLETALVEYWECDAFSLHIWKIATEY